MLIKDSAVFASLMDEHGRLHEETDRTRLGKPQANVAAESQVNQDNNTMDATLMQAEERFTGAVTWDVYKKYLNYAGGIGWVSIIVGLLVLDEAARGA
jgi:ATP-binding cassette, subfamily C (CFTR/MRP), member 1